MKNISNFCFSKEQYFQTSMALEPLYSTGSWYSIRHLPGLGADQVQDLIHPTPTESESVSSHTRGLRGPSVWDHCYSAPQTLVLKMFIHFQQMRQRKIQTLNVINAFNLEKCSLSWCYMLSLLILFTRPVFSEIKVTAILAISLTVIYLILYWFHVTLEMLLPLPKISSFLCLTY